MNAPAIKFEKKPELNEVPFDCVQPLSLEEIALIGGGTAVVNTI